jgi:hypothetical protein
MFEEKERYFLAQQRKAEAEFSNLESREKEMQFRTEKTGREFQNLKAETSDETNKTIS